MMETVLPFSYRKGLGISAIGHVVSSAVLLVFVTSVAVTLSPLEATFHAPGWGTSAVCLISKLRLQIKHHLLCKWLIVYSPLFSPPTCWERDRQRGSDSVAGSHSTLEVCRHICLSFWLKSESEINPSFWFVRHLIHFGFTLIIFWIESWEATVNTRHDNYIKFKQIHRQAQGVFTFLGQSMS